jgi:hypothetical protein
MNEPSKSDWVNTKTANINLIINNKIQIEMAEKILALCDEKISEFSEEPI